MITSSDLNTTPDSDHGDNDNGDDNIDHPIDSPIGDNGNHNGNNIVEYSVSELSRSLKKTIETGFGRVRVRGEISGIRRPGSGHLYFDLKDEQALIAAVCWKTTVRKLATLPEDGLEILATGRLSTYGPQSKYQLIVESLKPTGQGALLKLLEERKQRLAAEGLFAPGKKKPLPVLPQIIGVITSPSGAVLRDILHRLHARFPRRVVLWPVSVQGETAADQIAAAISGFNELSKKDNIPRPDLIIVARGGGSLEDLMAFNAEIVARAAANSHIPLISAIGHETDTTLIDHAADHRAPTPSAAAEMAVPVRADLQTQINNQGRRLDTLIQYGMERHQGRLKLLDQTLPGPDRILGNAAQWADECGERLDAAAAAVKLRATAALAKTVAGLRPAILEERLARHRQRLADLNHRITTALDTFMTRAHHSLTATTDLLESYSYRNVLARGYAVIRDHRDHPLTRASQTHPNMKITIEFADAPPVPAHIGTNPHATKTTNMASSQEQNPKPTQATTPQTGLTKTKSTTTTNPPSKNPQGRLL